MNCPKCGTDNTAEAKFCSQCQADLTTLSKYDQPENVAKYRARLMEALEDGLLEDWEEDDLKRDREELTVSLARHEQLVEEMGGSTQAPPSVAVFLDIAQIKKFHVGGTCVFTFLFRNETDRGSRPVSLEFNDGESTHAVKSRTIGPGGGDSQSVTATMDRHGGHVLKGEVSIPTVSSSDIFEIESLPYDVARDAQAGETHLNIDMSSARVADLSGIKMTSEESVSGVVTDSEWYQLKLVRVSAAIREIQKDEERQKQAQLEGAEEAKRQAEVAAKEKVRKDAEEAEEAKRRQELAQEQEKRESIRREQALDAELELKLKQDRQKAEQAEQQKAGGKKRFAVYQHSSEGFRAVRQGIVWWYLPVGFVVGVIPYAIGDWVGLSDPGGAMAMPAMLIWALATVASFKMSSFTARGLRKKGYELVDTVKANSEDEAIKFAKAEN